LVLYIRHLPPKGSLGEPRVYGGDGPPDPKENQAGATKKTPGVTVAR
jgi:hypothetical protein